MGRHKFVTKVKKFGQALIMVLIMLLMLEILLRVFDPWGLRYFNDLMYIGNELFVADAERDYIIQDGQYRLSHWNMTVEDEKRYMPDNNPQADCTIVLLGDSMTFGYGVNDDATFGNYLAQQFPDIYFVNTGMIAYNSTNVLSNYEAFPDGDAYLYLIVDNDYDPPLVTEGEAFVSSGNEKLPYLVRYTQFALFRSQSRADLSTDPHEGLESNPDMQRFLNEIDQLANSGRMQFVTFNFYVTLIDLIEARGYPVIEVTYPADKIISLVDPHLNAAGNQQLADELTPTVAQMQAAYCGDNAS